LGSRGFARLSIGHLVRPQPFADRDEAERFAEAARGAGWAAVRVVAAD
jgi:hypothetical protein